MEKNHSKLHRQLIKKGPFHARCHMVVSVLNKLIDFNILISKLFLSLLYLGLSLLRGGHFPL